MVACDHVIQAYPYNGGNMQWSNPGAGGMVNHHQQQGFGGNVGQQRGYGGDFGRGSAFGGQSSRSTGYGGGQFQGGAEAYQTNIFNEPDRYGYDYTFPGATVHFLMFKKRK